MRVIAGTARSRRLEALPGLDTRPTTDRVKESVFNVIQFDIEGRRALDLFAGTGQLGIEPGGGVLRLCGQRSRRAEGGTEKREDLRL